MATTLNEKTFAQVFTATGGVNGTRVNEQGQIVPAAAPAFEFDPITLTARGLRIRGPAKANLLANSQLSGLGAAEGTTPPSIATATVDGEACNAITFTPSSTPGYPGSRWRGNSTAPIVPATAYSQSAYVKLSRPLAVGESITVYYTGSSGMGTFAITQAISAQFAERFTRISTPNITPNVNGNVWPVVHTNTSMGSNLTVWICKGQVEIGPYSSTYIPTAAAPVTRSVENIYCNDLHLAPWFNKAEGTALIKYCVQQVQSTSVVLLSVSRTGNADRVQVHVVGGLTYLVQSLTNGGLNLSAAGGNVAGAESVVAVSWKAGRFALSVNGGAAVTASVATLVDFSQPSRMYLGS